MVWRRSCWIRIPCRRPIACNLPRPWSGANSVPPRGTLSAGTSNWPKPQSLLDSQFSNFQDLFPERNITADIYSACSDLPAGDESATSSCIPLPAIQPDDNACQIVSAQEISSRADQRTCIPRRGTYDPNTTLGLAGWRRSQGVRSRPNSHNHVASARSSWRPAGLVQSLLEVSSRGLTMSTICPFLTVRFRTEKGQEPQSAGKVCASPIRLELVYIPSQLGTKWKLQASGGNTSCDPYPS